ncbi:hypothetical protein FRC09_003904 [Ceratobasidium sp. 395]|nr:hypothetical protein FRC09_003904 [Ceratobasidium sp. 395]
MSHPLFWPSKTFFYPIGNTAAFSLTQDLSPEQPADVLLLGCGDPRNILFTLLSDVNAPAHPRKLDITCCDFEPAILARNILLFALLEGKEPIDRVWNIFYHFKIDKEATSAIALHSHLLFKNSDTIETWRQSSYSSFLQFVDIRTMAEVRRHWKSYAEFPTLSLDRLKKLVQEQEALSKFVIENFSNISSPARAAGMFWVHASTSVGKLFTRYWETGTIFTQNIEVEAAKNLNPTFVYSVPGEVFNPHYATFPQGFHLTPAMVPFGWDLDITATSQIEKAIVDVMKQQFGMWVDAFRSSRVASAVTIRFYAGEALAFCRALSWFATTSNPATGVFVSAWRATQVNFDVQSATTSTTPTSFDVIDTSNLTDHLGLLNILLATRPLLKEAPSSQAVLYTETLLSAGEDATKSFVDRIYTSIPNISALLGIAPRPYISAFSTHSNSHELLSSEQIIGICKILIQAPKNPVVCQFTETGKKASLREHDDIKHMIFRRLNQNFANSNNQFHERVAWVNPSGGDHHARGQNLLLSFDIENLARILFGLYQKLFAMERAIPDMLSKPSLAKLKSMTEVHYHQETLAMLLCFVKGRVLLKNGNWDDFTNKFLELIEREPVPVFGHVYYQDLCLQLHLFNIHTVGTLKPDWSRFTVTPSSGIFRDWPNVPPVLCVVMTVPRKQFKPFFDKKDVTGTPTIECHLTARGLYSNAYSSIHAVWGKCVIVQGSDTIALEEDPKGIYGKSDLVVMFWASSRVLEFANTSVSLSLKSTPQSVSTFMHKLGMELAIFSAMVNDPSHIRILPYRPSFASETPLMLEPNAVTPSATVSNNSSSLEVVVGSGPSSQKIVSLIAHVDISNTAEQSLLLKGAEPKPIQLSSCTMELSIGSHHHVVSYPYPILGSGYKLRVARKSHYVEIIVPVSEPLDAGGYYLDLAPIIRNNTYTPWNIHHVAFDRMPRIEISDPKKVSWLNTHTALQMSDRERSIRDGNTVEKASAMNALVNVKDTIHALVMNFSGVQGTKTRTIGLCEPDQGGVYTILLLGGLRLDLASFTIIMDVALVPLSIDRMSSLMPHIGKIQNANPMVQIVTKGHEVAAWKKLLPAFVERCRTWTHKANCEYSSQGRIPLTTKIDENPVCTCGQGIGFEGPEWKVAPWKGLLPFATRAAISPIFAVSYIETIAGAMRALLPGRSGSSGAGSGAKKTNESCWLCGSPGKPNLSACSRCKQARYCSSLCQRQDWPAHKGACRTA